MKNFDNYLQGTIENYDNKELQEYYANMLEMSSDYEKYEKKLNKVENSIIEINPYFDPEFDDLNK